MVDFADSAYLLKERSLDSVLVNQGNVSTELIKKFIPYLIDTKYWHAILIHNIEELNRNAILKIVLDYVQPLDLIPVHFQQKGRSCMFLARNCADVIVKLCREGLIIPHPTENDKKYQCWIVLQYSTILRLQLDIKSNVTTVLHSLFDKTTGELNLDRFLDNSGLTEYSPLSQPKILYFVLHISKIFPLASVKLSNNELKKLFPVEAIAGVESLKVLDLRNNLISDVLELNNLKALKLNELWLDGNPICEKFDKNQYVKKLLEIIPDLTKLDGALVNNKEIMTKQNFLCNEEGFNLVDAFLDHFFSIYDTNRKLLNELYHPKAVFSLTSLWKRGQVTSGTSKLDHYEVMSRNLLTLTSSPKRNELLIRGNQNIVQHLMKLPKTMHDAASLCVDLVHYTNELAVISVIGTFREIPEAPLDPERLLGFNRTFVLCGSSDRYYVYNDVFHVFNALDHQVTQSLKQGDPKVLKDVPVAETQKEKQAAETAAVLVTELNVVWAKRLLSDAEYDIVKFFKTFMDLFKQDCIPEEAFNKTPEDPDSFLKWLVPEALKFGIEKFKAPLRTEIFEYLSSNPSILLDAKINLAKETHVRSREEDEEALWLRKYEGLEIDTNQDEFDRSKETKIYSPALIKEVDSISKEKATTNREAWNSHASYPIKDTSPKTSGHEGIKAWSSHASYPIKDKSPKTSGHEGVKTGSSHSSNPVKDESLRRFGHENNKVGSSHTSYQIKDKSPRRSGREDREAGSSRSSYPIKDKSPKRSRHEGAKAGSSHSSKSPRDEKRSNRTCHDVVPMELSSSDDDDVIVVETNRALPIKPSNAIIQQPNQLSANSITNPISTITNNITRLDTEHVNFLGENQALKVVQMIKLPNEIQQQKQITTERKENPHCTSVSNITNNVTQQHQSGNVITECQQQMTVTSPVTQTTIAPSTPVNEKLLEIARLQEEKRKKLIKINLLFNKFKAQQAVEAVITPTKATEEPNTQPEKPITETLIPIVNPALNFVPLGNVNQVGVQQPNAHGYGLGATPKLRNTLMATAEYIRAAFAIRFGLNVAPPQQQYTAVNANQVTYGQQNRFVFPTPPINPAVLGHQIPGLAMGGIPNVIGVNKQTDPVKATNKDKTECKKNDTKATSPSKAQNISKDILQKLQVTHNTILSNVTYESCDLKGQFKKQTQIDRSKEIRPNLTLIDGKWVNVKEGSQLEFRKISERWFLFEKKGQSWKIVGDDFSKSYTCGFTSHVSSNKEQDHVLNSMCIKPSLKHIFSSIPNPVTFWDFPDSIPDDLKPPQYRNVVNDGVTHKVCVYPESDFGFIYVGVIWMLFCKNNYGEWVNLEPDEGFIGWSEGQWKKVSRQRVFPANDNLRAKFTPRFALISRKWNDLPNAKHKFAKQMDDWTLITLNNWGNWKLKRDDFQEKLMCKRHHVSWLELPENSKDVHVLTSSCFQPRFNKDILDSIESPVTKYDFPSTVPCDLTPPDRHWILDAELRRYVRKLITPDSGYAYLLDNGQWVIRKKTNDGEWALPYDITPEERHCITAGVSETKNQPIEKEQQQKSSGDVEKSGETDLDEEELRIKWKQDELAVKGEALSKLKLFDRWRNTLNLHPRVPKVTLVNGRWRILPDISGMIFHNAVETSWRLVRKDAPGKMVKLVDTFNSARRKIVNVDDPHEWLKIIGEKIFESLPIPVTFFDFPSSVPEFLRPPCKVQCDKETKIVTPNSGYAFVSSGGKWILIQEDQEGQLKAVFPNDLKAVDERLKQMKDSDLNLTRKNNSEISSNGTKCEKDQQLFSATCSLEQLLSGCLSSVTPLTFWSVETEEAKKPPKFALMEVDGKQQWIGIKPDSGLGFVIHDNVWVLVSQSTNKEWNLVNNKQKEGFIFGYFLSCGRWITTKKYILGGKWYQHENINGKPATYWDFTGPEDKKPPKNIVLNGVLKSIHKNSDMGFIDNDNVWTLMELNDTTWNLVKNDGKWVGYRLKDGAWEKLERTKETEWVPVSDVQTPVTYWNFNGLDQFSPPRQVQFEENGKKVVKSVTDASGMAFVQDKGVWVLVKVEKDGSFTNMDGAAGKVGYKRIQGKLKVIKRDKDGNWIELKEIKKEENVSSPIIDIKDFVFSDPVPLTYEQILVDVPETSKPPRYALTPALSGGFRWRKIDKESGFGFIYDRHIWFLRQWVFKKGWIELEEEKVKLWGYKSVDGRWVLMKNVNGIWKCLYDAKNTPMIAEECCCSPELQPPSYVILKKNGVDTRVDMSFNSGMGFVKHDDVWILKQKQPNGTWTEFSHFPSQKEMYGYKNVNGAPVLMHKYNNVWHPLPFHTPELHVSENEVLLGYKSSTHGCFHPRYIQVEEGGKRQWVKIDPVNKLGFVRRDGVWKLVKQESFGWVMDDPEQSYQIHDKRWVPVKKDTKGNWLPMFDPVSTPRTALDNCDRRSSPPSEIMLHIDGAYKLTDVSLDCDLGFILENDVWILMRRNRDGKWTRWTNFLSPNSDESLGYKKINDVWTVMVKNRNQWVVSHSYNQKELKGSSIKKIDSQQNIEITSPERFCDALDRPMIARPPRTVLMNSDGAYRRITVEKNIQYAFQSHRNAWVFLKLVNSAWEPVRSSNGKLIGYQVIDNRWVIMKMNDNSEWIPTFDPASTPRIRADSVCANAEFSPPVRVVLNENGINEWKIIDEKSGFSFIRQNDMWLLMKNQGDSWIEYRDNNHMFIGYKIIDFMYTLFKKKFISGLWRTCPDASLPVLPCDYTEGSNILPPLREFSGMTDTTCADLNFGFQLINGVWVLMEPRNNGVWWKVRVVEDDDAMFGFRKDSGGWKLLRKEPRGEWQECHTELARFRLDNTKTSPNESVPSLVRGCMEDKNECEPTSMEIHEAATKDQAVSGEKLLVRDDTKDKDVSGINQDSSMLEDLPRTPINTLRKISRGMKPPRSVHIEENGKRTRVFLAKGNGRNFRFGVYKDAYILMEQIDSKWYHVEKCGNVIYGYKTINNRYVRLRKKGNADWVPTIDPISTPLNFYELPDFCERPPVRIAIQENGNEKWRIATEENGLGFVKEEGMWVLMKKLDDGTWIRAADEDDQADIGYKYVDSMWRKHKRLPSGSWTLCPPHTLPVLRIDYATHNKNPPPPSAFCIYPPKSRILFPEYVPNFEFGFLLEDEVWILMKFVNGVWKEFTHFPERPGLFGYIKDKNTYAMANKVEGKWEIFGKKFDGKWIFDEELKLKEASVAPESDTSFCGSTLDVSGDSSAHKLCQNDSNPRDQPTSTKIHEATTKDQAVSGKKSVISLKRTSSSISIGAVRNPTEKKQMKVWYDVPRRPLRNRQLKKLGQQAELPETLFMERNGVFERFKLGTNFRFGLYKNVFITLSRTRGGTWKPAQKYGDTLLGHKFVNDRWVVMQMTSIGNWTPTFDSTTSTTFVESESYSEKPPVRVILKEDGIDKWKAVTQHNRLGFVRREKMWILMRKQANGEWLEAKDPGDDGVIGYAIHEKLWTKYKRSSEEKWTCYQVSLPVLRCDFAEGSEKAPPSLSFTPLNHISPQTIVSEEKEIQSGEGFQLEDGGWIRMKCKKGLWSKVDYFPNEPGTYGWVKRDGWRFAKKNDSNKWIIGEKCGQTWIFKDDIKSEIGIKELCLKNDDQEGSMLDDLPSRVLQWNGLKQLPCNMRPPNSVCIEESGKLIRIILPFHNKRHFKFGLYKGAFILMEQIDNKWCYVETSGNVIYGYKVIDNRYVRFRKKGSDDWVATIDPISTPMNFYDTCDLDGRPPVRIAVQENGIEKWQTATEENGLGFLKEEDMWVLMKKLDDGTWIRDAHEDDEADIGYKYVDSIWRKHKKSTGGVWTLCPPHTLPVLRVDYESSSENKPPHTNLCIYPPKNKRSLSAFVSNFENGFLLEDGVWLLMKLINGVWTKTTLFPERPGIFGYIKDKTDYYAMATKVDGRWKIFGKKYDGKWIFDEELKLKELSMASESDANLCSSSLEVQSKSTDSSADKLSQNILNPPDQTTSIEIHQEPTKDPAVSSEKSTASKCSRTLEVQGESTDSSSQNDSKNKLNESKIMMNPSSSKTEMNESNNDETTWKIINEMITQSKIDKTDETEIHNISSSSDSEVPLKRQRTSKRQLNVEQTTEKSTKSNSDDLQNSEMTIPLPKSKIINSRKSKRTADASSISDEESIKIAKLSPQDEKVSASSDDEVESDVQSVSSSSKPSTILQKPQKSTEDVTKPTQQLSNLTADEVGATIVSSKRQKRIISKNSSAKQSKAASSSSKQDEGDSKTTLESLCDVPSCSSNEQDEYCDLLNLLPPLSPSDLSALTSNPGDLLNTNPNTKIEEEADCATQEIPHDPPLNSVESYLFQNPKYELSCPTLQNLLREYRPKDKPNKLMRKKFRLPDGTTTLLTIPKALPVIKENEKEDEGINKRKIQDEDLKMKRKRKK